MDATTYTLCTLVLLLMARQVYLAVKIDPARDHRQVPLDNDVFLRSWSRSRRVGVP